MPSFPKTRFSLICRVQDPGNQAAWSEFLSIYEPVVLRMARRRGLQEADAQDTAQQVFLSVSQAIDRWVGGEGRPPFRAWLTTVARNAITRALTRQPADRGTGSTSMVDLLSGQSVGSDATAEMQAEVRREIVFVAADQIREEFAEQTWRMFWRTAIEGHAIQDVADAEGRTPGAVYVARYRVTSRLKESVARTMREWHVEGLSDED